MSEGVGAQGCDHDMTWDRPTRGVCARMGRCPGVVSRVVSRGWAVRLGFSGWVTGQCLTLVRV